MIRVQLDQKRRDHLFHFHILFHNSVESIRNKVHYDIKIYLLWLFSISVEKLAHFYTIRMVKDFQNFELTVLVSFILKNFFNSYSLPSFCDCRFKYDSKWAISNDLLGVIGQALKIRQSWSRIYNEKLCDISSTYCWLSLSCLPWNWLLWLLFFFILLHLLCGLSDTCNLQSTSCPTSRIMIHVILPQIFLNW